MHLMSQGERQMENENTKEVVEVKEATEDTKLEENKGVSRREALEVAIESLKPENKVEAPKVEIIEPKVEEKPTQTAPPLSPPAEYNAEEKADFAMLSRKNQEAALRLHKSRQSKLEEIKAESAELQWAKDIAKEVTPFLKARGDKEPPYSQIVKALKMVNEVDSNTKGAVAQILEAKGIKVPEGFLDENPNVIPDKLLQEKIAPLQEELNSVKARLAQEDQAKNEAFLFQNWQAFEQEKNASGKLKYPDLANPETGLHLASNIGSLVSGKTEMSKQFIANAEARIPDLTFPKLMLEAYRFFGGKVDESEAPRSQKPQNNHLAISRRAASSIPGRGVQTASVGSEKKFSSRREALAHALVTLNSD